MINERLLPVLERQHRVGLDLEAMVNPSLQSGVVGFANAVARL